MFYNTSFGISVLRAMRLLRIFKVTRQVIRTRMRTHTDTHAHCDDRVCVCVCVHTVIVGDIIATYRALTSDPVWLSHIIIYKHVMNFPFRYNCDGQVSKKHISKLT
jgi:hypothetical protein